MNKLINQIKTAAASGYDYGNLADTIFTSKVFGLPIFLLLMYVVFQLTFTAAAFPMSWLEHLFAWLAAAITSLWPIGHAIWLKDLIVDGVLAGVGGIIIFMPNILLLFLSIAILEESGYLARAALVMDRVMRITGLHGKSFIPLLIGFGCTVPAILGTRILENKRSRLITIMVVPLASCGARLTIYALIIPAFFAEKWRGPVLWLIYFIGILLAAVCAKILYHTVFHHQVAPFAMELPPYRLPSAGSICLHMWQRAWLYLKKAGTIVLAASIILWAAKNFPAPPQDSLKGMPPLQVQQAKLDYSLIGRVGKAIEPAIKPLGFDWKIGTALLGAIPAKELFVVQLSVIYGMDPADPHRTSLRERLRGDYSSLSAFCVMLFCLIAAPCVATLAATRLETNSWLLAVFQFIALTALAYILTMATFQLGRLIIS